MLRRPWLIGLLYASTLLATAGAVAGYLVFGRATLAGLDRFLGLQGPLYGGLGIVALVCLTRTFVQARRDLVVRRQAVLVATGLATTLVTVLVANVVAGEERWPAWLPAVMFLPVPAAVTVAILRGEFLDIRAVLNRTLVYACLTVVLLCVYALGVALVAALVGTSGVAEAIPAVGVVAVAFAPLRIRLQRTVDRLLYGSAANLGGCSAPSANDSRQRYLPETSCLP